MVFAHDGQLQTNMTTLTKTLLGISAAGFATGFATDAMWGFGKPVGAIFLGLFLISKMLEKEIALFDAEERTRRHLAANTNAVDVRSPAQHRGEPMRAAA